MTTLYENDQDLFRLMKEELFTAVVGDVLDKMGFHHQFLPPRIQPLDTNMLIAGRAMTVLESDTFAESYDGANNDLSKIPFGLMMEALDDLKPGEVYIAAGGSPRYAQWGEMMSTRAIHLGAAGAIVDGYSRDTRGILKLGFPTFSLGRFAQDQGARGKVVDWRVPIEIDGIRIETGSLVFADLDGIVIIPKEAEEEAISRALEKVRGENTVAKALRAGMSATEAFKTYGIM